MATNIHNHSTSALDYVPERVKTVAMTFLVVVAAVCAAAWMVAWTWSTIGTFQ